MVQPFTITKRKGMLSSLLSSLSSSSSSSLSSSSSIQVYLNNLPYHHVAEAIRNAHNDDDTNDNSIRKLAKFLVDSRDMQK